MNTKLLEAEVIKKLDNNHVHSDVFYDKKRFMVVIDNKVGVGTEDGHPVMYRRQFIHGIRITDTDYEEVDTFETDTPEADIAESLVDLYFDVLCDLGTNKGVTFADTHHDDDDEC